MKKIIFAVLAVFIFPLFVSAHSPTIVREETTQVKDPEISQAFYGQLNGHPHYFVIDSDEEFDLYTGIFVPDIPGAETDFSAEVIKIDGEKREVIGVLNGKSFDWEPLFEPFAGDDYFRGPDFSLQVPAGQYKIMVYNQSFRGKYTLVIGQKESFSPIVLGKMLITLPVLKMGFLDKSFYSVFLNYIGLGFLIILAILFGAIKLIRRKRKESEETKIKK